MTAELGRGAQGPEGNAYCSSLLKDPRRVLRLLLLILMDEGADVSMPSWTTAKSVVTKRLPTGTFVQLGQRRQPCWRPSSGA